MPQKGMTPLNVYSSVFSVSGSPPAFGLGCELNPFYLLLWILPSNVRCTTICLSLQMFKLYPYTFETSLILSNFQYKSYFSIITSLPCFLILFFPTLLVFWSQFMTCVAFTSLISMFLMFLFSESISLFINYTLFPIFNLLSLPQVPCPNLLLPSTVVSCHLFFVLDSDVVMLFFHISCTSMSLEQQWRNNL